MSTSNRVGPGKRIEGKFGVLIANPNAQPGKKSRCVRQVATGTVIKAIDNRTWQVKHDQDGKLVEVKTFGIRLIGNLTGVPVNETAQTVSSMMYDIYYIIFTILFVNSS